MAVSAALVLGLALFAGCGGGSGDGNGGEEAGGKEESTVSDYGIDFDSEEVQAMSEERAALEKLQETVQEWLDGATFFLDDSRTYGDFVGFIGCDATEYNFDGSARCYTWIADGADNSKLSVWFKENAAGNWCLYSTGSANLN